MKEIHKRYLEVSEKNPNWSSHTSFANVTLKLRLSRRELHYWFNRLVDKNDYARSEKAQVLVSLESLK